ncbi:unnamed protein product [Cylindrotheca closterium]|uniref:Uncharacterized protein n=1 Tax=Cylindrotheca closterium TaxID=2856 RepID=A0AAD2CFK5_9STRA|nr:unnamed protein product [Cylindrotheca closterium]
MESNDSAANDKADSTPTEASAETEVTETAIGEASEVDGAIDKTSENAENAGNTEAGEVNEVTDCWDAAIPSSKSTESAATQDEGIEKLQPGDHVTRWEMLPIAWPIQVHGIVLNVHEDTVVLVDFGLSAAHTDKKKPPFVAASASNESNGEEGETETPEPPAPKKKQLEQAIRNFKIGGQKREKNRLNINVLTNPKDISKWKKVNYEKSWFGGSNKKDQGNEKSSSPTKAQQTKNWFNRMATSVKERTGPGISGLRERMKNNGHAGQSSAEEAEIKDANSQDNDSTVASIATESETIGAESAGTTPDLEPAASQESNLSADLKASSSLVSEGSNNSDFTSHQMNPKMKELLQKKQEENPPKTMNPAMAKVLKKKEEDSVYEQKKKESLAKLPKADPSKLVLARTYWLLEHGESILPPYHAFSSNSECLAVFCKTGKWNTLQADVFLHSTAIGNAKTMGATTIAVAASAPLLAPAVAVAGIGAVAAPWLYLKKQKNSAGDSQQRLNDSFWAQAEPEVFVACIEAWSKDLLGLENSSTEESKVEGVEEESAKAKQAAPVVQQI